MFGNCFQGQAAIFLRLWKVAPRYHLMSATPTKLPYQFRILNNVYRPDSILTELFVVRSLFLLAEAAFRPKIEVVVGDWFVTVYPLKPGTNERLDHFFVNYTLLSAVELKSSSMPFRKFSANFSHFRPDQSFLRRSSRTT